MLQSILKAPSGPAVEKPVSLTFCEMPVNVHCGYLGICHDICLPRLF